MAADGPSEVTAVLTDQHQQIKTMMKQVVSAQGQDRRAAYDQLRVLLAAHEVAAEEVVHAIVRQDLGSDADVVNHRLSEEEDAANALATPEQLNVDSEQFTTQFAMFQKAVIDHAEAEGHEELAAVIRGLDADPQRAMVGALTQVLQLAQAGDGKPTASGDSAGMLHTARGLFQHQPSD
jgi:hemerythrin superfamily protein